LNINLIGMRGVGKSNVARRLAVLTKRPVMSTDVLIAYESGLTIPDFVATSGWAAFRDLEWQITGKLASMTDIIVDCGGGIMVDLDAAGEETFSERKVAELQAGGPVVWLRGDIERLAAKTAGDPARPDLHAHMSAAAIMRRREPWYAQAANWSIEVHPGQRQAAAESIAAHYGLLPTA
jgi:shikimate kinase